MKTIKQLGYGLISFSISIGAYAYTAQTGAATATYTKGASAASLSLNTPSPKKKQNIIWADMKYKADKRLLSNDLKKIGADKPAVSKAKQGKKPKKTKVIIIQR